LKFIDNTVLDESAKIGHKIGSGYFTTGLLNLFSEVCCRFFAYIGLFNQSNYYKNEKKNISCTFFYVKATKC